MKLFVVTQDQDLTGSYHSGGAALVFAEDLAAAKALAAAERGPSYEDGRLCGITDAALDAAMSYDVQDVVPHIRIFPNEGCC